MIVKLREKHPGFLYSTSGGGAQAETGRGMPSPAPVEADDYVLIHGNGWRRSTTTCAADWHSSMSVAVQDSRANGETVKADLGIDHMAPA